MGESIRLVVIIYIGFFLGLVASTALANAVLKIAARVERLSKERSKLAH